MWGHSLDCNSDIFAISNSEPGTQSRKLREPKCNNHGQSARGVHLSQSRVFRDINIGIYPSAFSSKYYFLIHKLWVNLYYLEIHEWELYALATSFIPRLFPTCLQKGQGGIKEWVKELRNENLTSERKRKWSEITGLNLQLAHAPGLTACRGHPGGM